MEASIGFACPRCSARLRIPDELGGRRVRCRACEKVVIAPVEAHDPDIRIIEREPDAEAIHRLFTPQIQAPRRLRKFAIGAGVGMVLLAFGILAWMYFFPSSPFPDLVAELPPGDSVLYRTKEGAALFGTETIEYAEAHEWATLRRGEQALKIWKGQFAPLGDHFRSRGFASETIDGETLYVSGDEACWSSKTRVICGSRALVLETLALRRGKGKRFLDDLDGPQRATLARLPRGEWMYFGKMPTEAERARLADLTRGLLEGLPSWPRGAGCSIRGGDATVAVGYERPEDADRALAYLRGRLDGLKTESRGRVSVAKGRLRGR